MSLSSRIPSHHRRAGRRHKPSISDLLLRWYDSHRRDLPWRAKPGERRDPYRIWLSEIMLQQTTVAAVPGYYDAFLRRWPSVHALAAAELDDIRALWAGLGYYRRASNLHRTAQILGNERAGVFPRSAAELQDLPGIGPYTAAAIAAIAFDECIAAIDTNGERVVARLFAVEEVLPQAKKRISALADPLVPRARPGDFAQALMDLGALVCTPKNPSCAICPVAAPCRGREAGIQEQLPRRAARLARPVRRGAAFVAFDRLAAVYLVRRPESGLLAGMLQPPLGPWGSRLPARKAALDQAPFAGAWIKQAGIVRHSFTHFHLEIVVYTARFNRRPKGEGIWKHQPDWAAAALPTVMRKILYHALGETGARAS